MAAAGFDVEAGDTWAVNELTSAIRRGDGAKRAEIRDFLRGLYDAGGEGPTAKGVVCVVGIGQRVSEVGDVQGPPAGVAPGHGLLDGHERVRERLVAGGLRRRPRLCRAGSRRGDPSRRARRLPPPLGSARERRCDGLGHRQCVLRDHLEPGRERRVAMGLRVRLDGRQRRAHAAVRLRPGLRPPEPQRAHGPAGRSLGIRVGAAERDPAVLRCLPGGHGCRPRAHGRRDPRLPDGGAGRPRRQRVRRRALLSSAISRAHPW